MPTVAAYAPPSTDVVRRELLRRLFLRQTAAFTLLAVGSVLSFFGPIIMAMIVWFTLLALGHWVSYWPVFAIALVVMLPLAFWTEFRTRGEFLTRSVGDGHARSTPAHWVAGALAFELGFTSATTSLAIAGGASPAGLVELMLWGPRQVLTAAAQLRVARVLRTIDPDRPTLLLQKLLASPRAVAFPQLLLEGETPQTLQRPLAYLVYYDWAGVSDSQSTAWALTEAREHFAPPQ